MNHPENLPSLCSFTMTNRQRVSAVNAVFQMVNQEALCLKRLSPDSPEYPDTLRGLESLRDLHSTLSWSYLFETKGMTLEAAAKYEAFDFQ